MLAPASLERCEHGIVGAQATFLIARNPWLCSVGQPGPQRSFLSSSSELRGSSRPGPAVQPSLTSFIPQPPSAGDGHPTLQVGALRLWRGSDSLLHLTQLVQELNLFLSVTTANVLSCSATSPPPYRQDWAGSNLVGPVWVQHPHPK